MHDIRTARLTTPMKANGDRQDHVRAVCTSDGTGGLQVTPFKRQDSSMLSTLAEANCLVIRPAHAPAVNEGDNVPCLILRSLGD